MRLTCLSLLLGAMLTAQAADVELLLLDRDGKPLGDAVLVLESSVPGPRPTPPATLVIAQEKMKFMPAVAVAHLSTTVRFTNLDHWDHHVRGGAAGPGGIYLDSSQGYAFRLAARERNKPPASFEQRYAQTGPQMLGCHLHGSMRGFLYVTDSPWAAVSDEQGRVKLSGVPAGGARLRIWHADALVETPLQNLQIAEGMAAQRISTPIVPRKPRRAPAEELKMPGY